MSLNEQNSRDMRRQDRFAVSRVIRVINIHSGRELGRLVNISTEGIMLVGSEPVEENCILELQLDCGDNAAQPVRLGVESLWCKGSDDGSRFWSGHYIIDISSQDMERLLALAG